jgi:L-ascorbate metabolism protein UlaG (beta-lactamase superfamily)
MLRRILYALGAALGAVLGGGIVAGWLFSAPKYRGPKSDHFDGKRFFNLEPTTHAGFRDMVKWMTSRDEGHWDEWREITPAPRPPQRVAGGELRVTWINHASFLIQTENVNILTDPIWSERCSPVQWAGPKRHHAPGIRFEDLPPIDAVVISHNHYDHMDAATIERLKREHDPRIFVGLGNDLFLKGATALDWWQSAELGPSPRPSPRGRGEGGVRVHVVPAQHFSSRGMADRDANLWCGFVLETPHGPIFFAGDTGWGSHFANIRARFGPVRLALLPIGAFRPEWFMQAVHISPKSAVRAAQALEAQVAIPMHYYTFHLGDDGQDEPASVLRRELVPDVRFDFLQPGETARYLPQP